MKARTASDGCGGDDSCMFMTLGPSISRRIMIPCGERKKNMTCLQDFFFVCLLYVIGIASLWIIAVGSSVGILARFFN